MEKSKPRFIIVTLALLIAFMLMLPNFASKMPEENGPDTSVPPESEHTTQIPNSLTPTVSEEQPTEAATETATVAIVIGTLQKGTMTGNGIHSQSETPSVSAGENLGGEVGKIAETYKDTVSVFVKDMTDGETFTYNENTAYIWASTLKAPYAYWLYSRAFKGELDMEAKITLRESDRDNKYIHGAIKDYENGTQFTIETLVEHALRHSDNTAMKMLTRKFGYDGFNEFFKGLGLEFKEKTRGMSSKVYLHELAFCIERILEFIEEGNEYSGVLKGHMVGAGTQLAAFTGEVAKKYGGDPPYWLEMGIVYDKNGPYLYAIMTNGYQARGGPIQKISSAIAAYMKNKTRV